MKNRTSTMPATRRKIETSTKQLCSPETKQRVTSELLKIGFGFNYIGTHYLADCIGLAVESHLALGTSVRVFMGYITRTVGEKYNVDKTTIGTLINCAIEKALDFGNIDYLLSILQGTFDYDNQKVTYPTLIMNLAEKIRLDIEQEYQSAKDLKEQIKENLDNITDPVLLSGICNIVTAVRGGMAL